MMMMHCPTCEVIWDGDLLDKCFNCHIEIGRRSSLKPHVPTDEQQVETQRFGRLIVGSAARPRWLP